MMADAYRDNGDRESNVFVFVGAFALACIAVLAIVRISGIFSPAVLVGQAPACVEISNDTGRLACYDRESKNPPHQPAKGANMPTRLWSH